jgi:hypothetical protein
MSDSHDTDRQDAGLADDRAELVDEDVIDGEYPPERSLGVDEALTPAEEQVGESVRSREARTERERLTGAGAERYDLGQLVAPGGDEDGWDDEAQEIALEADEGSGLFDDMTQDREEVLPAEEAAMHLTADPPMHDSDGYVDDEDRDRSGP